MTVIAQIALFSKGKTLAEHGYESRGRSEYRPEVDERGYAASPLPVWAIPTHLLSFDIQTSPNIGPLLEDFGFKILDRGETIKIPYEGFEVTCYRVNPPSRAWRRSPNEDGKSCTIISPTGRPTFKVVYGISDELTRSFSYGVEIL